MSYLTWRLSLVGSCLALLSGGCGEDSNNGDSDDAQVDANVAADGGTDGGDPARDVTIAFEAKVGEQPYDCSSSFAALGGATSKDFRMYVYDVRLVTEAGDEEPVELTQNAFQYRNAALLDFEDATGACGETGYGTPELHRELTGRVAGGSYRGVRFRVGLPSDLNHSNPDVMPPPLENTHLSWMWLMGRIYVNLDLVPAAGGGFPVHLGARGCVGDPAKENVVCSRPNIAEVQVDDFDPDASKVVIDLAELLAGVQVKKGENVGDQPGCMSQPDLAACTAIFTNLGVNPMDGSPQSSARSVFRAASRN